MYNKIVFIGDKLSRCDGISRVMTIWANFFKKNKNIKEVEVMTTDTKKPCLLLENDVKVTYFPFIIEGKIKKILSIPYNTYKMYKFLKERENSIIVFNKAVYIEPLYILKIIFKLKIFNRIKIIYFNHGGIIDFEIFYSKRKSVKHRVKLIAKTFNHIISLWGNINDFPIKNYLEKNIIIPNPVSFECNDLDIDKKENIILYVGRVDKSKGIGAIVKTWENIYKQYPNWKVNIVGDGNIKNELESYVLENKLERIKFYGARSDVKDFYKKSKIFVFPSVWYEGMPMVLLEAMACGNAIIASDQPANRNLISKQRGIMIEGNNSKSLQEALEKLLNFKVTIHEFAHNNLNYIKKFNINDIVNKWDIILK